MEDLIGKEDTMMQLLRGKYDVLLSKPASQDADEEFEDWI